MRRCLLVDDSAIIRRILAIMLERLGFAIIEAGTVADALAACESALPDVALIDWNLPDDDGISLLSQLRRLPGGEKMKLIMCTVERSVTQIETALAAGADEYITKPFGIEVLETKLGYLGFDLTQESGDIPAIIEPPWAKRLFSRVGFAGMTVAERDEAKFARGDIIFHQGDNPDFAYILLAGEVELIQSLDGGADISLTLSAFELFGDLALVESGPRLWTAKAATDCVLMRISRQRFQSELADLSPFMRNWIESLSERMLKLIDSVRVKRPKVDR